MVCIYPKLKNSKTYKSFGLEQDNIEVLGICENSQETTVELILIYDSIIHCFEGDDIIYTEGGNKIHIAKGEGLFVPKGSMITAKGIPQMVT